LEGNANKTNQKFAFAIKAVALRPSARFASVREVVAIRLAVKTQVALAVTVLEIASLWTVRIARLVIKENVFPPMKATTVMLESYTPTQPVKTDNVWELLLPAKMFNVMFARFVM
jgi:hypothetical protein